MEYGLAVHTASPQLGLAISNFAGDVRCSTWDLGRDTSSHLHEYLTEFLIPQTWADLAFIAVAKGPGGFTGTRIGVVTARTLAQQLDIPLFAVSTLAAVAWSHRGGEGESGIGADAQRLANAMRSQNVGAIALQMPAGRGQLFTAIYQVSSDGLGLVPLLPDAVMIPENWQQVLADLEMPYQLIDVPTNLGTTAISVLELADGDWQQGKRPHWSEALPFYGQHPVKV